MQQKIISIIFKILNLFFIFFLTTKTNIGLAQVVKKDSIIMYSKIGVNDTTLAQAIVYNGDTIESKTLGIVSVIAYLTEAQRKANAEWTRLRNAVYVTYPYAMRSGIILNDINFHLTSITDKEAKKRYIKSRENELKKEFTNPLTNLSVYQGKVLMKLINRETGNNCYNIIKEYKSGLVARVYQTVAFFFDTSLKQSYDAKNEDAVIEKIVLEVRRMYGLRS